MEKKIILLQNNVAFTSKIVYIQKWARYFQSLHLSDEGYWCLSVNVSYIQRVTFAKEENEFSEAWGTVLLGILLRRRKTILPLRKVNSWRNY